MYTLYYGAGSCSMAIHVALIECGAQFQLEKVDLMAGQQRGPEFLKINPRGQVPVLVDDGKVLREGAAILIYLLEKHKSPLLPASGTERTAAIEWLMFCNATLHPAYGRVFFLKRSPADQAGKEKLLEVSVASINKLWEEVEQRLSASPCLAGKDITIADILLSVIANWSQNVPGEVKIGPKTRKLLQTVIARPAYKKALETEQVEYKAAA